MPWRGAGVAIPLFSIRSGADLGVGEFLDLKLLVDWAVQSGFHLVQLLPINDTSVHRISLSVFALHPLYLRVQTLSENITDDINQEIQYTREQLDGKDVDYEANMAAKLSIAKKIYSQEKEATLSLTSFQNFFSENQDWLRPYAAFCFLRDFFETSDRSQWGRFSIFSQDKLSEASEYARKKGVVLKGDLPIGVDQNSVDTWIHPNLFCMDASTGAPPDYFGKNGQNWGFPTYNWEEMSKDNYAWWRARLTQLPDHAMTGLCGNFRQSIPLSQFKEDCNTEKKIASKLEAFIETSVLLESEAKLRSNLFDFVKASVNLERPFQLSMLFAFALTIFILADMINIVLIRDPEDSKSFYPRFNLEDTSSFGDLDEHSRNVLKRLYYDYYFHRQETPWRQNALKTLPVLLNSSDMLACGEDLRTIPSCVHPVMQELGLIGLHIQRMPNEPDKEFGVPSQYSYMTIVYFILQQHFESPSMWAIFPLQDLLALKEEYTARPAAEETINDPTNPKHYWRYRFPMTRVHVTVESLLTDKVLITEIKDLVRGSGRSYPSLDEVELHSTKEITDLEKQPIVDGKQKVLIAI
ncbi:unnamed protein product [Fraxinus pennsylvanica]|uniref:4-alpha-glucanotransferase n=1 Tax=Fraxinus pennsylvanica TaxID=56036 RepID=A0AAD2A7K5_9LAMI|nr:unnamed protein product [Fraxinus pennsylvanica]